MLNIFQYLKKYIKRSWIVFDPESFEVDWTPSGEEPSPQERATVMGNMYPDAIDNMPHNMPEPRGEMVNINSFVDSDHAGNMVTRRSHTGIIIYLNMAPIAWYSKRQNTVESSTFGSEFIALKTLTKLIQG